MPCPPLAVSVLVLQSVLPSVVPADPGVPVRMLGCRAGARSARPPGVGPPPVCPAAPASLA